MGEGLGNIGRSITEAIKPKTKIIELSGPEIKLPKNVKLPSPDKPFYIWVHPYYKDHVIEGKEPPKHPEPNKLWHERMFPPGWTNEAAAKLFRKTQFHKGPPDYQQGYAPKRDKEIVELIKNGQLAIAEQAHLHKLLGKRIPKVPHSPVFTLKTKSGSEASGEMENPDDFVAFTKWLKGLGVSQVNMGGTYLSFKQLDKVREWSERPDYGPEDKEHKERMELRQFFEFIDKNKDNLPSARKWIMENKFPSYCVGILGNKMLLEGFDVSYSDTSFPNDHITY